MKAVTAFSQAQAIPKLKETLHVSNVHAVPRITKVLVSAGVGKRRAEANFLEDVEKGLTVLTGQHPVPRLARKSIAALKVRQGQTVGLLTTLRGRRMEDFLSRLLHVVLPRVRDFRGIPQGSVDERGNLSIGFREAAAFPEVDPAVIGTSFGLEVTIVTTAKDRAEGMALFRALSFPFADVSRGEGGKSKAASKQRPLTRGR